MSKSEQLENTLQSVWRVAEGLQKSAPYEVNHLALALSDLVHKAIKLGNEMANPSYEDALAMLKRAHENKVADLENEKLTVHRRCESSEQRREELVGMYQRENDRAGKFSTISFVSIAGFLLMLIALVFTIIN